MLSNMSCFLLLFVMYGKPTVWPQDSCQDQPASSLPGIEVDQLPWMSMLSPHFNSPLCKSLLSPPPSGHSTKAHCPPTTLPLNWCDFHSIGGWVAWRPIWRLCENYSGYRQVHGPESKPDARQKFLHQTPLPLPWNALRRLKTWCRSSLTGPRLDTLALAYINHSRTYSPEEVLRVWDQSGYHRIALVFRD